MRKNLSKFRFALLGILMCLISVCAIGQTERTYSYTFTKSVWSALGAQSIGGWNWIASGTSTGSFFGYDNTKGQQFGSGSAPFTALTLSTNSIKGTVTSVKVNTSGANSINATFEVKVGGTNLLVDTASTISVTKIATEYEFTGSAEAGTVELIWNQTSSKALYIKSIEVTYIPDPSFVDAPTFTPSAGNYYEPASVTLATVAEGATIYYTIDGTEPTTSSLLYQDPISVEQTTTIKAIAVRDTNSSEISAAVYSFPINVNTIAAFKAQGINNSIYKLTTTAKVIYNNPIKKYLFIQDETGALVMYNYTGATYNAGDEITGPIYGTYSLYDGMNEMVFRAGTPALPEATAGTPVDAIVATIAQLKNDYAYYEGRLVTVKNVTFIGNKKFVQGEDTMAFYTQLVELPEFEVGIPGNITGLVVFSSQYTGVQLFPRSINDIELPIELPVVVDFDENPAEGWVINNVTGNNKWYIGQAQGFDNNKLYISSTNGLTNKYGEGVSYATFARFIKIPAVGAKLTFDARINGENNYDYLSVMFKGQTLETYALNNEWNNYTIDIAPEMAGAGILQFVWQNNGSVQNQFPAAVDNISIIPVACAQVTDLNATVDSTTATITWTAPEDQTAWTLEYKLANHSEWYSVNATTPSVVLNNLQGNSNYDVRVKAICGGESSLWTSAAFAVDCQQEDIRQVPTDVVIGTGISPQSYLFNGNWGYGYSANLYTMTNAGAIHSIAFYQTTAQSSTGASLDLWVKAVPANYTLAASNTFNQMLEGAQQICSGVSDFSTAGWKVFNIEGGFTLEEGQNLLVLSRNRGCSATGGCSKSVRCTSTSNTIWYKQADRNDPGQDVSGQLGSNLPNITINIDVTTIVCVDPISCSDLVSVEANDLTPNTAAIDWTLAEGSTQNNFVVEYKPEGSEMWAVVPVQDATTYELTGLIQKTNYVVRVKAICGENDYSNYVTTSFTTPGVCPPVMGITSTNNANATTLTWLAGGEEGAWTVEFRPVGTENWVSLHVSIIPMTTLGGLVGNTDYEVRIKALCDAEDEANQSAWTYYYFTSGCAAVDIPYTQVFGSYTEPACWSNQDFDFAYYSYAAANDIDAWLMSPAINIPADEASYVKFKVDPTGSYKLMASYRGTALARFAEIYAGTSADNEVIVEVPEIYRGRMVNFMLQNGVDNWFRVYNMNVITCPFVPSQLAASNITTTSAQLSWVCDERVTSWNLEYRVEGGEWTSVEVSTNPYTLTGLEASTTYQVRVKTACNETYSNTVSFTTPCPAREVPFFEGFENTEFEPECWMNYHVSGPGSSLWQRNISTNFIHTGSGSAKIPDMSATTITNFVTPAFIIPEANAYRVSVWVYRNAAGTTKQNEGIKVWASTEPEINSSSVELFHAHRYLGFEPVQTTTGWYKYEAAIPISGDNVYVIFQGICEWGSATYMDDITVERIPTCETPSISVINAVATVTPGQIGNPESYDLQIGDEVVTGVQSPANLSVLFGLEERTEYEVAVRTNCGEGDYSEWSAPVSFTTPCAAISLDEPYIQDFENAQFTPDCWLNYHVSGPGSSLWQRNTSTNFIHTGSGSAQIPDMNATTITNFVSPAFIIPEANAYRVSVWVYRNAAGTTKQNEGIKVWASTEPEINSTSVELFHAHRYLGFEPVQTTTGWYRYEAAIPISGDNVYVIFQGICEWGSATYMDDITVERIPTCETPSISVINAIATITPGQIGNPESYDLQIGNEIHNVTTTNVDLIAIFNLSLNTDYEVRVRSNCGENDGYSEWSAPVSFTTPSCLGAATVTIGTGTSTNGNIPFTPNYEYSYSQQIFDAAEINAPAGGQITEFSIYCSSVPSDLSTFGNITVWMSNTTKSTYAGISECIPSSALTQVYHLDGQFNLVQGWNKIVLDEPFEYDGTSNLAIAMYEGLPGYRSGYFYTTSTSGNKTVYIYSDNAGDVNPVNPASSTAYGKSTASKRSNIKFVVCPAPVVSCGKPTIVVDGTTATITPHSVGTPESYDLHIDGFQDQTVSETTVDLATLFTGLASGTTYQVTVRANCGGGDYSDWSNPVDFTTPCEVISTLPYSESFENSYPANCWTPSYASSSPVNLMSHTAEASYDGTQSYRFSSYSESDNFNQYLLSPEFDLSSVSGTVMVSFYYKSYYSGTETFRFGYSSGSSDVTSSDFVWSQDVTASTSWQRYEIVIPATGKYFAINYNSDYQYYMYVDNVNVEILPTCFAPEYLSAALTDTSAVITWADSHSQNNYVVEYKEATAETWNTATTTEMTYTITGLTPSTDYNFRVKADCGEGDESEYATIDFTTYCPAYYFVEGELICPKPADMAITGIKTPLIACEVNDPVTITVKNTGFVYPITAFTAHYVLNEVDTVTEPVVLNGAQIEVGQEMVYSFNTLPSYELGFNSIFAWVELEGVELDNNYIYDFPYVVTPNTVPYVMNTVPEENLMGWNAFDENNDGITMNLRNRVISYSYNDTLAANDWMISPCFNLAAGTYNIIFDYEANSSLSEQFALYFGQGSTPVDMTQLLSQFVTVDNGMHAVSVPVIVAEDGTYNFGFYTNSMAGNMGFQISNIEVLPVLNVTVSTDGNGTTNPTGVVAVNYGENLTLAITPNEMYHVSGVFVDGVQVVNEDPYNSNFMLYTLENVTENHDVNVEFKLEFHIIKSVENVNAAYTDVPGYFIPAATDTLVDPNPVTANFRPSQHYHFVALELGIMSLDEPTDVTESVVANPDGSYSYTIDTLVVANYYLNAIFERNKVNINYNVLTGKGYANDSEVLTAPESYTTIVDHSINGDIDTTVTFAPYTTGDVHSDYHIVDVTVDGESQGVINNYTFTDITANHNVDIKYGYQVNATVRNYAAYNLGSTEIRGTIAPAQQLVAEGEATTVTGTIQEHFHLYNLFVDGVDMINDATIVEDPATGGYNYTYTIASTQANYNIEAVVKLDTVGIHYHIDGGQGYADFSGLLNEGDNYITHINFGDSILSVVAPAPGYSIANYMLEGFNMGAIDSYQFNYVTRERYVHLTFVPNDITIVTNAYGHGTVSNGMNFTYNPETPVNYNFVATPDAGYHITSVMINGESQVVPISGSFQYNIENVTDNYTFDVFFEANTYTMTSTATGTGMINPVGVQTVAYGSDMNYVATANVGSYISSVVVDGVETTYTQVDNVVTLNIPFNDIQENHNVAVTFAVKSFGITADVDENGHGSIDLSQHVVALVNYGMSHVFNFIPEEGYHVSQILVDGEAVEVADSYQFVDVQANHTLVVSFAINEYTLTATSNVEACTITPAQTTANYGTTVNYTINVATGYHLVNVMDNGAEVTVVNNAFAIANINDNHVINANFEANTYVVTVNQPNHAVITPGTQTVTYGATPEYVIVPQAGYEVVSVTAGNALVPVTDVNGVGYFTLAPVHGNLTINAVVAEATYTITVLPSQGQGTVSPATNQTVVYGDNQVFTFTPAANYVIGDIIVDGVSKGALTSYTFVNVVANHTIQAVFEGNCLVPTNLSVDNVTATSAQLSWSNTGASAYTVRYQAIGETTYHETTTNTNSCTINGLTADAIYYWSVKSNCGAGLESEFSYELQFITEPSSACAAPTNLTVEATYFENVKVSWTSNAAAFNLRCKRQGDDPATYVYVYGVHGTEYTFYNLMSSTTYNWGVQTICNEATGNVSAWVESTFTTSTVGIASEDLSSIKVYSHLNNVYVVNENGIAIKDVKIYDIYGKLVYSGNATSNPEVIALNVANGNYVVKLDTENGVAVYKLAIIR